MKRTFLLLAALALLAACAKSGEPSASGPEQAWMHRDKLYDVVFVGDHAWVVGYPGVIIHSTDRGASWEAQQGGLGAPLFAVDFVDPSTGWIAGREGLVLHTKDGGKSWTKQETGSEEPLLAIDFVDARHGWAVGNFGEIRHTSDGGQTWVQQSLGPDEDPVLNGVSFVSPTRGWIAGEFGGVFATEDGGQSWRRLETGTDRALFDVRFAADGSGVAVGSAGTILTTADGGESWRDRSVEIRNPLFNAHHAGGHTWACGRGGVVLGESEEGFVALPANVYVWLSAIAFTDDGQTGLAVGRAGTIIRTTDGGATWAELPIRR